MRNLRTFTHIPPDVLLLQSQAEHAGCALACSYSSSAEFEAAVIRSKLDAGVYGPKRRRRRYALVAGAVTGMLMALVLMF
jgi:hypothetical protein